MAKLKKKKRKPGKKKQKEKVWSIKKKGPTNVLELLDLLEEASVSADLAKVVVWGFDIDTGEEVFGCRILRKRDGDEKPLPKNKEQRKDGSLHIRTQRRKVKE